MISTNVPPSVTTTVRQFLSRYSVSTPRTGILDLEALLSQWVGFWKRSKVAVERQGYAPVVVVLFTPTAELAYPLTNVARQYPGLHDVLGDELRRVARVFGAYAAFQVLPAVMTVEHAGRDQVLLNKLGGVGGRTEVLLASFEAFGHHTAIAAKLDESRSSVASDDLFGPEKRVTGQISPLGRLLEVQ